MKIKDMVILPDGKAFFLTTEGHLYLLNKDAKVEKEYLDKKIKKISRANKLIYAYSDSHLYIYQSESKSFAQYKIPNPFFAPKVIIPVFENSSDEKIYICIAENFPHSYYELHVKGTSLVEANLNRLEGKIRNISYTKRINGFYAILDTEHGLYMRKIGTNLPCEKVATFRQTNKICKIIPPTQSSSLVLASGKLCYFTSFFSFQGEKALGENIKDFISNDSGSYILAVSNTQKLTFLKNHRTRHTNDKVEEKIDKMISSANSLRVKKVFANGNFSIIYVIDNQNKVWKLCQRYANNHGLQGILFPKQGLCCGGTIKDVVYLNDGKTFFLDNKGNLYSAGKETTNIKKCLEVEDIKGIISANNILYAYSDTWLYVYNNEKNAFDKYEVSVSYKPKIIIPVEWEDKNKILAILPDDISKKCVTWNLTAKNVNYNKIYRFRNENVQNIYYIKNLHISYVAIVETDNFFYAWNGGQSKLEIDVIKNLIGKIGKIIQAQAITYLLTSNILYYFEWPKGSLPKTIHTIASLVVDFVCDKDGSYVLYIIGNTLTYFQANFNEEKKQKKKDVIKILELVEEQKVKKIFANDDFSIIHVIDFKNDMWRISKNNKQDGIYEKMRVFTTA